LAICLNEEVSFRELTAGFDSIQLVHCALPELNLREVDPQVRFLGKTLSMPLMITGMTGGFRDAEEVNRKLARVGQAERIALGVGSQRQVMENPDQVRSFTVVREEARDVPIIGNIGAAQVRRDQDAERIQRMVELLQADALAVHLNPLQEALQPEGDTDYTGVLRGLERLVRRLEVPLIVKETGAGISRRVAERLVEIGVEYIDVSGAGGTSWAAVESFRSDQPEVARRFWDWGIPTVLCIREVAQVPGVKIIASGGVRNGLHVAKAIALGAVMAGAARPFLLRLFHSDEAGLREEIDRWRRELRIAMFVTGSRTIEDLKQVRHFRKREFQSQTS